MRALAGQVRRSAAECFFRAAWLSAAGLVAVESGVTLESILDNRPSRGGNRSLRCGGMQFAGLDPQLARTNRARRQALYLAVVHFGLTQSAIARAAGMSRQQVFSALRRVEDEREAAAVDALLDSLALRLPAPASGYWGAA